MIILRRPQAAKRINLKALHLLALNDSAGNRRHSGIRLNFQDCGAGRTMAVSNNFQNILEYSLAFANITIYTNFLSWEISQVESWSPALPDQATMRKPMPG
jgi:hypothetical protein